MGRPKAIDFKKLVEPFLSHRDVSTLSRLTYLSAIKQFCSWIKVKKIKKPDRQSILSYKTHLEKTGLSPYTQAKYLVVVRLFFGWLEREDIYKDVARGIKPPKRSTECHQRSSLSLEQVTQLFRSIDTKKLGGKRDFAMINLLVRTGIRLKEATMANVGDLEELGKSSDGGCVAQLFIHGKGRSGKDQSVFLTEDTFQPIAEYFEARKVRSRYAPLFASLNPACPGGRFSIYSLSTHIKRIFKRAGIENRRITPHSLRHTFGVLSIQAGSSLYDLQLSMRHREPSTTELYLRDIENLRRLEAGPERKVGELLSKALSS